MSAYGDRLTPDEIRNVSSYVLQQAQTGWIP
jgi:mono/diheme cytochrome c family protein